MDKNCFIGAGLSAFFAQLLYWREGDLCLYPSMKSNPYALRRPELEMNKLFASSAKSFGSTDFHLTHASLHDRSTIGGNSEIWGGFFDAAKIRDIDKLYAAGVQLVPLAFDKTGSESSERNLVQLQESDGKILSASNHLRPGVNKYLDSIHCDLGQIKLNCASVDTNADSEITVAGKVFVCTGVVQTIDLLMRSELIKPGDELTLDEFDYELVVGDKPLPVYGSEACVISYTPGRAAAHLMGLQRSGVFSSLKPFAIHQVFHARKKMLRMFVGKNSIKGFPDISTNERGGRFGKSIHYCNLKINGERLVEMAARLAPNLHFVSMASVVQTKPGPISSDIFAYLESLDDEL